MQSTSIPHACGGEPEIGMIRTDEIDVFPTHVGVNRRGIMGLSVGNRIPHACGGEPAYPGVVPMNTRYSPRMWG